MKKTSIVLVFLSLLTSTSFASDCPNFSGVYKGKCGKDNDRLFILQNGCQKITIDHKVDDGTGFERINYVIGVETPVNEAPQTDELSNFITELRYSYRADFNQGKLVTNIKYHIETFRANKPLRYNEDGEFGYTLQSVNNKLVGARIRSYTQTNSGVPNSTESSNINCEYDKVRDLTVWDRVF